MHFTYALVIAALLLGAATASTPVKSCKEGPLPKDVRVTDCDKTPCKFIRGTNVTAEWDFTVSEDTKTLKPRVRAIVLGQTVNYPFPQKDACETLKTVKCPLSAGEEATYVLSMPISKRYPRISLSIEFAFLDDSDEVATCFKMDAKITDK